MLHAGANTYLFLLRIFKIFLGMFKIYTIEKYIKVALYHYFPIVLRLSLSGRKTVVVGAGYIAVELAGILNALGSDTSILIRYDKVVTVECLLSLLFN